MGPAAVPPRAVPSPDGPGHAHRLRAAEETARSLAVDAAARERDGRAPLREVSALREAGLLTLPLPAGPQDGAAGWATAYAVVREIAAADGPVGQLLARHCFLSWSAGHLAGPGAARRTAERSASERWCWGGGYAPQEPPLLLARTSGGLVLDGRQSFSTGVLVADRLAVRAVREDTGEPLAVVVDPGHRGVTVAGDALGRRLAGGGSVECCDVPVAANDVLGSLSTHEDRLSPRAALLSPVGQLLSVQVLLGTADRLLTSGSGSSPHGLGASAAYGEPAALARSAAALADRAVDAVRAALDLGDGIGRDGYERTAALVTAAGAAASRAARETAVRALGVAGARAASARLGLDGDWRETRAHTWYEPFGDPLADGARPPFALPA
ncbi:acyl-CoA dehydrogenase [Streptomyces sp. NPDC000983]|uniref:acyl-CoA dehydrogenase n=1 Tax=Streptomyces sp. NPDC000983 TaxID=3154373 RepID=UPI003327071A